MWARVVNHFFPDAQGGSSTSTLPRAKPPFPAAVPKKWSGKALGDTLEAQHSFPCIGEWCALDSPWKAQGTVCQPFFDAARGIPKERRWQHMCMVCVKGSIAEEEEGVRRFCNGGDPDTPLAAAIMVTCDRTEAEAAAAQQLQAPAPVRPLAASSPRAGEEARFISHRDERVQLGKPIWQEVAARIPRVRNDGMLSMPQGSHAPDITDGKAFRAAFPRAPRLVPEAASVRAAALKSRAGGVWTQELREEARSYFECEAAGVECVLVMPEVVARDELLADPRYQVVQSGSSQLGCKLFCPCCETNEFVLLGGINVKAEKSVRFAFGNGRVMVPISRCYVCVNPACPAVINKPRRKDAALELKLLQGAPSCLQPPPHLAHQLIYFDLTARSCCVCRVHERRHLRCFCQGQRREHEGAGRQLLRPRPARAHGAARQRSRDVQWPRVLGRGRLRSSVC